MSKDNVMTFLEVCRLGKDVEFTTNGCRYRFINDILELQLSESFWEKICSGPYIRDKCTVKTPIEEFKFYTHYYKFKGKVISPYDTHESWEEFNGDNQHRELIYTEVKYVSINGPRSIK